jgi:hypothetical protein
VEDEFGFHLQERVDDLVARGMDYHVTREEALRGFGDIEQVKTAATWHIVSPHCRHCTCTPLRLAASSRAVDCAVHGVSVKPLIRLHTKRVEDERIRVR